ncbi:MAG: membrane protein insertion efficiency factor YidD [Rickettsiales bacterium]|jgi:putative membrane protein insertion efficiency factor|nr:membrane protein insertion efficiency factor YidD [Rickettsiales bacterium]
MRSVLKSLVRLYQVLLSPVIGGRHRCRFFPRCSDYAIEAIDSFGAFKGSVVALKRIMKCNPFSAGGHDPVNAVE